MEFKDRLKKLRKDKELTQQELAEKLNLQSAAISKYETGQTEPGLGTLISLSELFEVSVDYLVGKSHYIEKTGNKHQISPREMDLINRFRRLSTDHQIRIDERIATLLDMKRTRK
ncbi:MAG: helix-turn-helix domain-containing protein [Eubacteriaceae bacterium]